MAMQTSHFISGNKQFFLDSFHLLLQMDYMPSNPLLNILVPKSMNATGMRIVRAPSWTPSACKQDHYEI